MGNILKFIFKLFISALTISWLPVFYCIGSTERMEQWDFIRYFLPNCCWSKYVSVLLYLLIPICLSWLFIFILRLDNQEDNIRITEISYEDNTFLPVYLGFFFVGLSLPNVESLVFVCFILYIFIFAIGNVYYNPLFILLGYKLYRVKNSDNVSVYLITRRKLKSTSNESKTNKSQYNIIRINDYTFMEFKNEKSNNNHNN